MDPLSLLREYQLKGQLDKVVQRGDRIEFGDSYSFMKNCLTAFKSKGNNEFYTLETVWFFLVNYELQQAQYSKYLKYARERTIPQVTMLDRKDLGGYLKGEIEYSDSIVYADTAGLQSLEVKNEGATLKRSRQEASLEADGQQPKKQAREADADNADNADGSKSEEIVVGGGKYFCKRSRDRNTMLKVPLRDFSAVLDIVKNMERENKKQQSSKSSHRQPHHSSSQRGQHHSKSGQPPTQGPLPVKASGRFERDTATNQLNDLKDESLKKMQINVYGYKSNANASNTTAVKQEQKPQIVAPPSSSSKHKSSSSGKHHSSSRHQHQTKHVHRSPVILVPSGYSAVMNLYNIKQFLEEGVFVSSEDCQNQGMKKPKLEVVKRKSRSGKQLTYHVKDKPPDPKSKAEWDQVVAVVAQGVKWQFKEWPHKGAKDGDLLSIFNSVCGFMFRYADELPSEFERSWNVTLLEVHKQSRHHDKTICQRFWDEMDRYLETKKPHLLK